MVLFVAQRRAPVYAFAKLKRKKTYVTTIQSAQIAKIQGQGLTVSEVQYTLSALGHVWLQMRPTKMFFTHATISSLETLRWMTWVGSVSP
jgi:hypothetical protein